MARCPFALLAMFTLTGAALAEPLTFSATG